jgi:hypothetical protein
LRDAIILLAQFIVKLVNDTMRLMQLVLQSVLFMFQLRQSESPLLNALDSETVVEPFAGQPQVLRGFLLRRFQLFCSLTSEFKIG